MAGFRDKLQRLIRPPDDEYEDYYEDEQETAQDDRYDDEPEEPRRPLSFAGFASRGESSRESRAVSLSGGKGQGQVSVYKPTSFGEDTRTIADDLLERHTVVLNLERADKETARRIVDFLSGVAYANHGRLKPIASNIVIITPYNVELSVEDVMGDLDQGSIYF